MRTKRTARSFTVIFVRCEFTDPPDPRKTTTFRPAVLDSIAEELYAAVRDVDTVAIGERNAFVVLAEGVDDTHGLDVFRARIVEVLARPIRVGNDRIAVEAHVTWVVSDGTIPARSLHSRRKRWRVVSGMRRRSNGRSSRCFTSSYGSTSRVLA